ncbi:MAG TPA: transketolase [Candidatus Polarisedimenticolia bacterium]|jgi:transketolase|nr:transketolase [Candidatus Polarisedimenticolia bacterium]
MPSAHAREDIARLAINTIKTLAIDAVEQAKSGHPGMPMGAADYAFFLWTRHLRFDPRDPGWPDRDRFVLSAGHGSMLLYALLHLSGFDLPLEEIKRFRQWESRTPGHPERGCAPGVETTTGPLGQGFGNAVGMAIAANMAAARFNVPDHPIVSHRIWVIASDGDLMEGVASEAASIAGHLALSNLTVLYDDNHITIEGDTELAFSEDVGRRFEAYGWSVQRIDGHDHDAITAALARAAGETSKPGLIVARTHIAQGSPGKHDTADAHGSPLGPDEAAATKKALGWPAAPPFLVPDEVRALFAARAEEGGRARQDWQRRFEAWSRAHPEKRALWDRYHERSVPEDLFERLLAAVAPAAGAAPASGALPGAGKPEATRVTSGRVLQAAAELVPSLCGGSADLEPSTKTSIKGSPPISRASFAGRNFHFGVREHGMGAVLNGLALHGGPIPYGATFLIFSDYMRPPIRLAAMAGLQVVYVFTHDSVFLGEDGPTHQPIEQVPGLRLVPNLAVLRPADGLEVAMAWTVALRRRSGPTALVLTRQDVPPLKRAAGFDKDLPFRGGYILSEAGPQAGRVVLIATGSEVAPAQQAQEILAAGGIGSRLVSMPSPGHFLEQPEDYRRAVVPTGARAVVIEAARLTGWERVAGPEALLIGLERYGYSAPWKVIAEKLGFTGQGIAERVRLWLGS